MTSDKAEKALRLFASLQDTIRAQQEQHDDNKNPSSFHRPQSCVSLSDGATSTPSRPTTSEEQELLRRAEAAECLARRLHQRNKQLVGQVTALKSEKRNGASGGSGRDTEAQQLRGLLAARDAEVRLLREELKRMGEMQRRERPSHRAAAEATGPGGTAPSAAVGAASDVYPTGVGGAGHPSGGRRVGSELGPAVRRKSKAHAGSGRSRISPHRHKGGRVVAPTWAGGR